MISTSNNYCQKTLERKKQIVPNKLEVFQPQVGVKLKTVAIA